LNHPDPPLTMMAAAPLPVVIVDDGHAETVEGLAVAVAAFGQGRLDLVAVGDWMAARSTAARLAAGVVVVDVDRHPDPRDALAKLTEGCLAVVVLTDGRDETVAEHARSVGAVTCLTTSPAHEVVSRLCALAEAAGSG
jgi:AmiR/NasT family two-component response regulator